MWLSHFDYWLWRYLQIDFWNKAKGLRVQTEVKTKTFAQYRSSTPRMLLSHLWYLWVHFTIDCMHMHVQYIWEWAPTPIEWEWVGYITVWCAVDMIHGVHVATSGNATVMSHYFLSKIPVHTLLIFELSLCSNYKI